MGIKLIWCGVYAILFAMVIAIGTGFLLPGNFPSFAAQVTQGLSPFRQFGAGIFGVTLMFFWLNNRL